MKRNIIWYTITIHKDDMTERDIVFKTTKRGAIELEKVIREKIAEWDRE